MRLSRRIQFVAACAIAAACERAKAPIPVDSAAVKPAGALDSVAATQARSWDPSAGPLLLVAAPDAPDHALVVVPDSASADATIAALPRPASVTLLSRSGTVQTAELPAVSALPSACLAATLSAAPPPRPWNVGFVGGVVSPLATDSLEALPRADSASLVFWMNRLASALPNDSAGRFTGLPFVVRALWRVNVPAGPQLVVGALDRQLNQEATPLQERTFLVAERSVGDSSYATVYTERTYGLEETIQNQDVLAAVLLGSGKSPAIIVARDFGDATAYSLIERGDDGRWRQRWISARRHC